MAKKMTKAEAYYKQRAAEADELEALLRDMHRVTDASDPIGMKAIWHGSKLLSYLRTWESGR